MDNLSENDLKQIKGKLNNMIDDLAENINNLNHQIINDLTSLENLRHQLKFSRDLQNRVSLELQLLKKSSLRG